MTGIKQRSTFISYSRTNKDFALRLAKELRAAGISVWLDLLDIPTGSRWDDEVEKALESCEIFMVILTPASITSENVKDEIGYAIDAGKYIVPVLLENAKVPLRLRRFQYVDFTSKSYKEGVETAKRLLRSLVEEQTVPRMEFPAQAQNVEEDHKATDAAARLVEQKAEEERLAKAKGEADRLAAQQKAEAERLAKQKAEEERLAQAKAETDRKAKEEAAKLAALKKAEEERLAKVKAEADRKAKAEADRLAAQQKAEAERLAKQRAEEERLVQAKTETDRKAKEEAAKLAALKKAEEERLAKVKAEADRKAKAEAASLAAQQKAEAERLAKQKAEKERLAQAKAETDRKAKEEAAKLAALKKAEEERLAQAKAETDRKANAAVASLAALKKTDEEPLVKQKAEEERLVQAKAASDRPDSQKKADEGQPTKAKAAPSISSEMKEKSVPITATQKRSIPTRLAVGIAAIAILAIGGIVFSAVGKNRSNSPSIENPAAMNIAEADAVPTSVKMGQASTEANEASLSTASPEADQVSLAADTIDTTAADEALLSEDTTNASACKTPVVQIKVTNLYLRTGPDIRFEAVAQYKNGDKFTLLGRYRDWFLAKASDGNEGWLYKDWLKLPANLDTDAVCSVPLAKLPPTPGSQSVNQPNNQDDPENSAACVPTYYTPCN